MKYLCLAYYDEALFQALPAAELEALVAQCRAHDEALRASGRLLLVGSLAAGADSRALRPQAGRTLVSDGPYTETREQVGAFFLIEAADAAEAIATASLHPAARLGERVGWGIELRPVEFYLQPDTLEATP